MKQEELAVANMRSHMANESSTDTSSEFSTIGCSSLPCPAVLYRQISMVRESASLMIQQDSKPRHIASGESHFPTDNSGNHHAHLYFYRQHHLPQINIQRVASSLTSARGNSLKCRFADKQTHMGSRT